MEYISVKNIRKYTITTTKIKCPSCMKVFRVKSKFGFSPHKLLTCTHCNSKLELNNDFVLVSFMSAAGTLSLFWLYKDLSSPFAWICVLCWLVSIYLVSWIIPRRAKISKSS